MKPIRAGLARLLTRAAELRAGGISWEHVATTLRRSAATCRRWPQQYPDLWRRLYATAARERLAEGGAEGLRKLREMLRSEDEKTRRLAVVLERQRAIQIRRNAVWKSQSVEDRQAHIGH